MRSSRLFWITAAVLAIVAAAFGLRADDKPPARPELQQMPGPSSPSEIEGKTFEQWRAELKHEDPSVREKAIRAIILFGPEARKAVPDIVERCLDRDASPRIRAVIALTVIEIDDRDRAKVIEALNGRLEDIPLAEPQGIVKYHAALALTRFGDEAKAAIPGLVKAIADTDKQSFDTRRVAIIALRKIARDPKNGPDPRATDVLLQRLEASVEPASVVRLEAMIALAVMGRPADKARLQKVERTLEGYKNSSNKLLSIWAHYGVMAHKEVNEKDLTAIASNIKSPDVVIRVHTATALGAVGSKARTHVEAVTKLLEDKDGEVFVAACGALVTIGGDKARAALTKIAEAKDDDPTTDKGRKMVAQLSLKALEAIEKEKDKADAKDGKADEKAGGKKD
jgi:HEAT repeat protein